MWIQATISWDSSKETQKALGKGRVLLYGRVDL